MASGLTADALNEWTGSVFTDCGANDVGRASAAVVHAVCPTIGCRQVVWAGERRLACSLPCRRCGQCYPPGMYPETMRPETVPGLAHAWALLQDAEHASVGEEHVQQALEAAEEAIRCLAHRPPQAAGQPSEANAGVRFRRPGTWWLLNTAIRAGNAQALSRLCCLPQFIEALTPNSQNYEDTFSAWFRESWCEGVITGGLAALVLDLDDTRCAYGGGGGTLFPCIYKAVIRVYNKGRQLKLAGFGSGSFLRPFLQDIVTIPRFHTQQRVDVAIMVVKQLKSLERSAKLFSRPIQGGCSVLSAVVRSGHPELVSAVLDVGDNLVSVRDSDGSNLLPIDHAYTPSNWPSPHTSVDLCPFQGTRESLLVAAGTCVFWCLGLQWAACVWQSASGQETGQQVGSEMAVMLLDAPSLFQADVHRAEKNHDNEFGEGFEVSLAFMCDGATLARHTCVITRLAPFWHSRAPGIIAPGCASLSLDMGVKLLPTLSEGARVDEGQRARCSGLEGRMAFIKDDEYRQDMVEITKLLVERGAEPLQKGRDGEMVVSVPSPLAAQPSLHATDSTVAASAGGVGVGSGVSSLVQRLCDEVAAAINSGRLHGSARERTAHASGSKNSPPSGSGRPDPPASAHSAASHPPATASDTTPDGNQEGAIENFTAAGPGGEEEEEEDQGEQEALEEAVDIEQELAQALKSGLGWSGYGASGGHGDAEGGLEWDLRLTEEFKESLFGLRSRNPLLLRSTLVNLHRSVATACTRAHP